MKYYFLLLTFFLFSSIFSQIKISDEEKSSLKIFLRVLTENSEAGYVFFNKKPACIHGYYFKDPFRVNSNNHREAVALMRGASVWKKLKNKNSNIIIHISEKEDPQIPGQAHVLVINEPLFHQVVNENLSLFQYVLGPTTTSQKLLNALVIENQPFHALLKYDKVLIGIILGFGTQNSIYGSRMENILEASNKEIPPFLLANSTQREFDQEYLPFPPSLGFKTAVEEINNYSENLVISSHNLQEKKPNFVFGWFNDKVKNKKIISDLEETQVKIQKLIHSENFEENIIEKIISENIFFNPGFITHLPPESEKLKINKNEMNRIIAKGLWELLQDDNPEYLPYFIEGIENPNSKNLKTERLAYFPNYLNDFIAAKENLKEADSYFQSMHNNKDFQCVDPFKLYYRTLEMSEKQKVCKGSLVTLTYSIYSPLGHYLGHGSYEVINLKNTIIGFAHGIKGMSVGETREIFIHPSLAYGFDSSDLDKCIYLKAVVTLEEVHNEEPLPEIKYLNFDFLSDPEVLKSREINYKNALAIKGAIISSHLRKYKDIDLFQVNDYLNKFHRNKKEYTPTTQAEQDIINHIHWNIYFSGKPEGQQK